jgi:hypothetical protein
MIDLGLSGAVGPGNGRVDMRILVILMLSGALGILGCDSSSTGSAGSGGDGGSAGSGGSVGSGGEGGGGGGMTGGEAPVITSVTSTPVAPCENGVPSDYRISIAATDAETPADQLTYSGGVPGGCFGEIDAMVSTINCVNGGDYPGAIAMVEDPQGNMDTLSFTITRCTENVAEP